MSSKIMFLLSIVLLSGCSSIPQYSITYNTEPSGASIICNGINKGYSPVTLYYRLSEEDQRNGSINTSPCTAIWSTGVRSEFSNVWDLKKYPNAVMQTLPRPNVEGYSQDVEFSLKVMNMKSQRNQALAAQKQAEAAKQQAYETQKAANEAKRQKNCIYYALTGMTHCY